MLPKRSRGLSMGLSMKRRARTLLVALLAALACCPALAHANDTDVLQDEATGQAQAYDSVRATIEGNALAAEAGMTAMGNEDAVRLTEGVMSTLTYNDLDEMCYRIDLARGALVTLHYSYTDSSAVALASLLNADGGYLSMWASGGTSMLSESFGPIALEAGTYYFRQIMTGSGSVSVWYTDSSGEFPGWRDATHEKAYPLADKMAACKNGGPLAPVSTPIEVDHGFIGTIYTAFGSTSLFVDDDLYVFTPQVDGEYLLSVRCADPIMYALVDNTCTPLKNSTGTAVRRYNPADHGGKLVSELELGNLKAGRTYYLWFTNYTTATVDDALVGSKTGPYRAGITNTGTQPMHRLYNQNSGEHFYTADLSEAGHLVGLGWQYEGRGWVAPVKGDPVYRLYNPNEGEHHYTLDAAEKDALVAVGWSDEGVGWYSDTGKSVPLYREYNPNQRSCNHNYTTNKGEHDELVSLGWQDEGVGWYAVAVGG